MEAVGRPPVGVYAYVRTDTPNELTQRLAAAGVPTAIVEDSDWAGVVISVAAVR